MLWQRWLPGPQPLNGRGLKLRHSVSCCGHLRISFRKIHMISVTYLQKQARVCRGMAVEVAPSEATCLSELFAAYEDQVYWVVTQRSTSDFMLGLL